MAKKKNTSKKSKTRSKKKSQGWVTSRKVLFRPERLKYVRKMLKDEGCVFCNSAQSEINFQSLCVYKSQHSQVVLNKFPYNSGHLLIIPLKHYGDIFLLNKDEYSDLQNVLLLAMKAVSEIYKPNGFNVGLNHGASSGAGIPQHIHYHIVPRWHGDLNFFPLIADTKVVVESLEDSYEKFLNYFKNLKDLE